MFRYKFTLEYDGTGFHGWQRQANTSNTIQETVEKALSRITRELPSLFVAGRTDAGVHALGQVVHADFLSFQDERALVQGTNFYLRKTCNPLPGKINILTAEKVDNSFHARFSAKERTYLYRISNRSISSVFDFHRAWHVRPFLDVFAMQEAAHYLIGTHDFTTFRAVGCQALSPIRTIHSCEITREGEIVNVKIRAPSFLYHQVRIIVGNLKRVGEGKWPPSKIKEILQSCNRQQSAPTAPADGLYFVSVQY